MYRSRSGSKTRKHERIARTRQMLKRDSASLLVTVSFWQMTCELNEHRGNALHFRGGRSCYSVIFYKKANDTEMEQSKIEVGVRAIQRKQTTLR